MIMTFDERVEEMERALAAIETEDGWIKRTAIADALGRRPGTILGPTERAVLNHLVALGKLEQRTVPTAAPSKYRWEYRLVREQEHNG